MLDIFLIVLFLLVSFVLIVKGADFLVDGAADLARWLKVPPLVIGLTIVAFGTSLPEFIVTIFSAWSGSGDIAVGNIIGSNIVNIGLILGISAIIVPLFIRSKTLMYELPFVTVSSFLLIILGNNFYFFNQPTLRFDRIDGVIFLLIFVLFLAYMFSTIRKERKKVAAEFKQEYKDGRSLKRNALFVVGGLIALILGGKLFIHAATKLALIAGLSEAFIGVVIAAIGTSLPELASSAVAAWKKQGDIAVGNVVGSNIFNILFVLGTAVVIKPITISATLLSIDAIVMVFLSLLLLLFAAYNRKITRAEGAALVAVYLIFVLYQLTSIIR